MGPFPAPTHPRHDPSRFALPRRLSATPMPFHPDPFPYHHELELTIDTLTNRGVGLGRADGWVVMVPFALPGERVRARVFRNHPNYSEADLVAVLAPAPDRVAPACPLFGTCGGCQYQHLAYESQLRWKRDQVREALERIGGLGDCAVDPTLPSPLRYGYRTKLTPHHQGGKGGEEEPIGFLRAGQRRRIVDVPECPIATEAINEALPEVRRTTRETLARRTGKRRGATLLLRDTGDGVVTDPNRIVRQWVGDRLFQFRAGGFFQNNASLLPAFAGLVAAEAARHGARHLVDAYCGAGFFALSAADSFESVHGIEVDAEAVQLAESNAALNRIPHATFHAGEAADLFARVRHLPPGETAVVLDPPRRGCDAAFLAQLRSFAPRTLVYVSCDPATQARDLRELASAGYTLERVQPVDLFPQTRHIECVVRLARS